MLRDILINLDLKANKKQNSKTILNIFSIRSFVLIIMKNHCPFMKMNRCQMTSFVRKITFVICVHTKDKKNEHNIIKEALGDK